jgi:hypothetical protein
MAPVLATEMKFFDRAWAIGLVLILLFVLLSELLMIFDDYVFVRLGMTLDRVLLVLWTLPLVASYIAARYSPERKLLAGLSLAILFPALGAIAHYVNGVLGGTVDMVGLSGALVTFKVYLAIGGVLMLAGTLLGLLFSKSA